MLKKVIRRISLTSLLLFFLGTVNIYGADAICYNCPPQWADWASQLKMIKKHFSFIIIKIQ